MTKQIKISAALAKQMTDFGTKDGSVENIRIEAINAFAVAMKSGKSNSMPVDINADGWNEVLTDYANQANNAYIAGQNKAAGYTVVSEGSAKTYATYFRTVGAVAVKSPDLIDGLLAATNAYCSGKSKKDLGGRTKLMVYYRMACEVRDTVFGKKVGKVQTAARTMKPSELTAAAVGKAIDATVTRAKRTEPTVAAAVETIDTLKASAIECAAKIVAAKADAKVVPVAIRKALALIATWK